MPSECVKIIIYVEGTSERQGRSMSFVIGEYLVYCGIEICKLIRYEKMAVGNTMREYCVLEPMGNQKSSYFVPVELKDEKLRKLLSKEEVMSLIGEMSTAQGEWTTNMTERKNMYAKILHSNNYHDIIKLLKTIHDEDQKRKQEGKHLPSIDEKALKSAEQLIHQEFSLVLGIPQEQIPEFIEQRANK